MVREDDPMTAALNKAIRIACEKHVGGIGRCVYPNCNATKMPVCKPVAIVTEALRSLAADLDKAGVEKARQATTVFGQLPITTAEAHAAITAYLNHFTGTKP